MYADYDYFRSVYFGGDIPPDVYERLATRASDFIDYYTQGRAKTYSRDDAVKKACCALVEQYQVVENCKAACAAAERDVASETVGGYSVSYRSSHEELKAAESALTEAAKRYLGGTGLLYRGGCYVHSSCCDFI